MKRGNFQVWQKAEHIYRLSRIIQKRWKSWSYRKERTCLVGHSALTYDNKYMISSRRGKFLGSWQWWWYRRLLSSPPPMHTLILQLHTKQFLLKEIQKLLSSSYTLVNEKIPTLKQVGKTEAHSCHKAQRERIFTMRQKEKYSFLKHKRKGKKRNEKELEERDNNLCLGVLISSQSIEMRMPDER